MDVGIYLVLQLVMVELHLSIKYEVAKNGKGK